MKKNGLVRTVLVFNDFYKNLIRFRCSFFDILMTFFVLIIVTIKSDNTVMAGNNVAEVDKMNFDEYYYNNSVDNAKDFYNNSGNSGNRSRSNRGIKFIYSSYNNMNFSYSPIDINNTNINIVNVDNNINDYDNNNSNSNNKENNVTGYKESTHERVLSRQKRYLIFPEGSSLQVVFDEIIPIVDYNNYLIFGITVALAWELPSKRPSELLEEVKEKLNDGTLGLRQDEQIEKLEFIDNTIQSPTYNSRNREQFSYVESKYYNPNERMFSKWNENPYYMPSKYNYPYSPIAEGYSNYYKYKPKSFYMEGGPVEFNYSDWNFYPKTIFSNNANSLKSIPRKSSQFNKGNWNSNRRTSNIALKRRPIHSGNSGGYQMNNVRKHQIYPVFGKRSIDDDGVSHRLLETEEGKFHLRYHRSSRHGLYFKIEKYLHSQGKNGLECVLKTLCETGQRRHEKEPDTFVREIMRAIFTIPESIEPVTDRKHRMYDDAHSHKGNCSEKYSLCPGSIWSSDFIF